MENDNAICLCCSAAEIDRVAKQLAMEEFINKEQVLRKLHGTYINIGKLKHALSANASNDKVQHAFMELVRFCEDDGCYDNELLNLYNDFFVLGVQQQGDVIHENEKRQHGRRLSGCEV